MYPTRTDRGLAATRRLGVLPVDALAKAIPQRSLKALRDDKRGRKTVHDPRDRELDRLRHENTRLTQKLKQAETIIEIQKKVAALLGNPIETSESIEKP